MNREIFEKLSKIYDYIPMFLEIEKEFETPITLFKKLCKGKKHYLLESTENEKEWGRYSYIGRNPFLTIKGYKDHIVLEDKNQTKIQKGRPIECIKNVMNQYKMPHLEDVPTFFGGAVGYIGYDTIKGYENIKSNHKKSMHMPMIHLLLAEELMVYDHHTCKITIIIYIKSEDYVGDQGVYEKGLRKLKSIQKEIIQSEVPQDKPRKQPIHTEYTSNETKESFIKKVKQAKEYIKNGDIFQVVLSQRFEMKTDMDSFYAYETLRKINPSPYLFYIDFDDYQLVGSSPELLTRVHKDTVKVCCIAGTRKRGENILEDDYYAKELLEDEKEKAEHLMLVDLGRNDIGKVAEFKSVAVDPFMDIEKYSHVMHMVSYVSAKKQKKYDAYDALMACFPAGTVSGAPKVRAMEIIEELENEKRGVYAGAVGYFGFDGNMDMCIAIRTIVLKNGIAYIQAGAGIVSDSNPENEYEETFNKAKALIEVIMNKEG